MVCAERQFENANQHATITTNNTSHHTSSQECNWKNILVWGPPHNYYHQMSKEKELKDFVAAEDNPGVLITEIHKGNIWDANGYGNTLETSLDSLCANNEHHLKIQHALLTGKPVPKPEHQSKISKLYFIHPKEHRSIHLILCRWQM